MDIQFHCSHCSKLIKAPPKAGGKRGKCPYCKQSVYVPSPPEESGALELAPLDDDEERKRREMADESLRIQAALHREKREPPEGGEADEALPHGPESALAMPRATERVDVQAMVVKFVRAMQSSQLEDADRISAELARTRRRAREHIQRLMVDEIPPPGLEHVSPALLKGFLRTLLERL